MSDDATQFIFKQVKSIFMPSSVKEEEDEQTESIEALPRELPKEQVMLMSKFRRSVKEFDPAQSPQALAKYGHLMRRVDVRELRFTHDEVRPTFRNGAHGGVPFDQLTRQLQSGETDVEDITPLVAVQYEGVMRVVFGNRRLKALKDYADLNPLVPVCVRCLLHNFDDAGGEVPLALFCKWVHASTTANGGTAVAVRGAQPWQGVAPPRIVPPRPRLEAMAAAVPAGILRRHFLQMRTLAPRLGAAPAAGGSWLPAPAQES